MTAIGFLKLPPEIRNRVYQLVLRPYRINITRDKRINAISDFRRCIYGRPLALRGACKTIRTETRGMLPSSTLSVSEDITHIPCWWLPKLQIYYIRRLVVDDFVASNLSLLANIKAMPQLDLIAIYMCPSQVESYPTATIHYSSTLSLDIATLASARYDREHVQRDVGPMPDYHPLHRIRSRWKKDLQAWTILPKIMLKQRWVFFDFLQPGNESPRIMEVVFILEEIVDVVNAQLKSLRKIRSDAEGKRYHDSVSMSAAVGTGWDFGGTDI